MKVKELLEKRATLVNQARAIYDTCEKEKREPTAEERENFDKMMAEVDTIKDEVTRMEKLEAVEKTLEESRGRQIELEVAEKGEKANRTDKPTIIELRKSICGDERTVEIAPEYTTDKFKKSFRRFLITGTMDTELRALQKDSDIAGGFLSAPQQFQAELIKAIDNIVFMRQKCRVLPPISAAESLGAPSLDADPADPTWTAELAIGAEDSTMTFGKRELFPHPLAQYIKVSKTLLRRSTIPVDGIVRGRLAYKCGVVQENTFLNGSGALQPLGVFTVSDDGIGTGRDVSTGNTSAEIRFDGLIECEFKLKAQYRRTAEWIFHRDAIKQIRKLKDGEGRYIWVASVVQGEPDRILNMPVNESEYAPSTFDTTLYVGILGDFRNYWIVDALTMQLQVLIELYAATNQNAYITRLESDGMPVLAEAFARVQLA